VHNGIISASERVEFITDRMSYITISGRWCDNIYVNVHAPTEDKSDDINDSFMGTQSGYFINFRSIT